MSERVNFIEGSWFVAVTCVEHGELEERVATKDAKTERMARIVAFERHMPCQHKLCAAFQVEGRKEAIATAELEVTRADALLEKAQAELAALEQVEDADHLHARRLMYARAAVERYAPGPTDARMHLEYVRDTNG